MPWIKPLKPYTWAASVSKVVASSAFSMPVVPVTIHPRGLHPVQAAKAWHLHKVWRAISLFGVLLLPDAAPPLPLAFPVLPPLSPIIPPPRSHLPSPAAGGSVESVEEYRWAGAATGRRRNAGWQRDIACDRKRSSP